MLKKIVSLTFILLLSSTAFAKLQDPMNPLLKVKERKLGMDLQAIGMSGGESYCMIDGKMYKVGDVIKDLRIVDIQTAKIIMKSLESDKIHELKL